jgi:DNA-binding PadR family transcriptional regulator
MHRAANFAAYGPGPRHGACHPRGGFDIGEIWRAMAGGRGPGDESGRHGGHGGHGHGRHGGHGRGAWGRGGPFGPGPGGAFFPFGPGGPRGGGRRGGRARRGDVRTAALLLLAEEPRNGYQIMQALEERSGGAWRPSPGSVYPALQQLEDEGLITTSEQDGRKLYELTDAGRTVVAERGESAPAPWDELAGDVSQETWELLKAAREAGSALFQVLQTGSEAQRREAQRIVAGTRRDLYRLLADGDPVERADSRGDDTPEDGEDSVA